MKKWLLFLLGALLIVAIGLAVFFGIKAKDKDSETQDTGVTVSYVENEYSAGSKMIYKVVVQRDETIETVKYSIDNKEEIVISGVVDEAKNKEKYDADNGKYVFESDTDFIALSDLSEATHILNIYVYNEASERIEGYSTTFKIVG